MAEKNITYFPNFLVAGAAKCGTTTLYHYLRQHPDVYMSPIKEPNHFSTDIQPKHFSAEYKLYEKSKNLNIEKYVSGDMQEEQWGAYVLNREHYLQLFKFAKGKQRIGEISNSYMFSDEAALNIKKEFPSMKIVMILRQPAERAYSHYLANLRDGRTTRPFREEVENDDAKSLHGWCISHLYYELGLYAEQIKKFQDHFPMEQVKIFLFDDLKTNNHSLANELFTFLGLRTDISIDYNERHNEARVPKNPGLIKFVTQLGIKRKLFRAIPKAWQKKAKDSFFKEGKVPEMSEEDKKWMTSRYVKQIEQLEILIQRDLTSWK
ncbi:MAG: sulfotransferase [Bacteroidia bacterium]